MKKMSRQLRIKLFTHVLYGLGASIILIAIMFKLTHHKIPYIGTDSVLIFGFVIEAIVFAVMGLSVGDIIADHKERNNTYVPSEDLHSEVNDVKKELRGIKYSIKVF